VREIALGLRLAVTGGRNARLRAGLTALGIGLGMIVLLTAASVPTMIRAIDARQAARSYDVPSQGAPAHGGTPDSLLIEYSDTTFHDEEIRGARLQPEGPRAPKPPGVAALPGPGELVVSPELRALLDREPLLRERLAGPIVGTIGDAGLIGPREYAYYAGADDIRPRQASRISAFGYDTTRDPMPAFVVLILAVGVVVLLLPVGVFVATAVRFGSDQRDRRLAALRLVGADRAMAVRIAAGEALFGALGGMALGVAGFYALRPLAERLRLQDISVFATDIRPDAPLVAVIVIAVPAAALIASVVALRRVVVEPLGVTRQGAAVRRRLWWRLLPLGLGAALLAAHGGDLVRGGNPAVTPISVGVGLMLIGITALLPWLVDVMVRRLGGGGVPWQLAVRRLQADGGTAARAVGGVAVAVAGAIALQTVLAEGQRSSTVETARPVRADVRAGLPTADAGVAETLAALRATPGVRRATAVGSNFASRPIHVGSCADLREYARIGACRDGDSFVTGGGGGRSPAAARHVPARSAPDGYFSRGILLTPAAAHGRRLQTVDAFVDLDRSVPDAIERVRNTMARLSPSGNAYPAAYRTALGAYRTVRRGIFAGAFIVLALIAASLLVGGLEQLRERRPVLAALSAFGVPRGVLARSVLWQAAVPIVLGLAVSVSVGLALAALLLRIGGQPFSTDWAAVAAMTGAGAAVIALVTLATLPALSRLMRPEGLRAE
jgi:hypothetical protein